MLGRFDGFRFDGVTSMLYWDHGLNRSFRCVCVCPDLVCFFSISLLGSLATLALIPCICCKMHLSFMLIALVCFCFTAFGIVPLVHFVMC